MTITTTASAAATAAALAPQPFASAAGMHDLARLGSTDIDLTAIAEQLAKLPRYNGATPGLVWDVASHSMLAMELARNHMADYATMAQVLLHDVHEFILGDRTRPVERWLAWWRARETNTADRHRCPGTERAAIEIDAALYRAIGMPAPTPDQIRMIRWADDMALVIEWQHFMPHCPADAHGLRDANGAVLQPIAWRRPVPPSSWMASQDRWLRQCLALARACGATGPAIQALALRYEGM